MTSADKILTIVYQFGKVASTSLVNTLKANALLDVHQSHFLGEHALQRIVPVAVDKSTNAYFHEHLKGQLLRNVALTYRMNRVLDGEGSSNLKVISLSRDPVDWLRSGILQDIEGYRTDIIEFARKYSCDSQGEDTLLRVGLEEVIRRIGEIVDRKGGASATVNAFHEFGGRAMFAGEEPSVDPIVRRLFFLALRPLTWFEEHFRPCFGIGLEQFDNADGIWAARLPRADLAILRYEDISTHLTQTMASLELPPAGPLLRKNVSATKPHSSDVNAAFASQAGADLRSRLLDSQYAKHFGYDQVAQSAVRAAG